MNAAEGFRRVGKLIGYAGWLPLVLLVIDTLRQVADGTQYPRGLLFNLFCCGLVLAVAKSIEWLILGFTAKKVT